MTRFPTIATTKLSVESEGSGGSRRACRADSAKPNTTASTTTSIPITTAPRRPTTSAVMMVRVMPHMSVPPDQAYPPSDAWMHPFVTRVKRTVKSVPSQRRPVPT